MTGGSGLDRRALLVAGVAGAAGVLLPGCGSASEKKPADPASERDTATEREGDLEILDAMLALEKQSVALYAGHGGLLRRLHAHELEHVARIEDEIHRLGGTPRDEGWTTEGGRPLELALKVEETAFAAYLDALPKIVDSRVRGVLATIAATEAEHLAAVQGALGRPQATTAFVTGRRSL